ncbi:ABC transporter ATP-binding protein [Gordonia soli]|uniref:Putative ABC transporter permease/ATP-binding protein n=1 Tax=Gordonia soli NBRC 108243 TaxID=1223545 RepID=M0QHQ1_9ACTN|nr:ABC transporter ATP-binding protein [Gordonia soli]GAC67964.1 putative ABC transporter permease/ATP-binding protein [Gordonia soli NBRC 108243]
MSERRAPAASNVPTATTNSFGVDLRALGRLLRATITRHKWFAVAFALCQMAAVGTTLAQPTLNATIIDDGILRRDIDTIERLAVIMVAVAVGNLLVSLGATYLASHISSSTARDLRARVHGHIATFGDAETARFGVPSLLTRSTGDVINIQSFSFTFLTVVVTAPLMLVGAIILSLSQGWRLAPAIAAAGILLVVVVTLLVRRLLPISSRIQRCLDAVNETVREQITGTAIIRTFRQEGAEMARFDSVNTELAGLSLRAGRLQTAMMPLVTVIANLATVVVAGVGALFVDAGMLQVGQIVATIGYLLHILVAVSVLSILAAVLPRAVASAARVTEVLDTEVPPSTNPATAVSSISPAPPSITFDAVTFRHPGAAVSAIADVSLVCRRGTTTGIIGGTGSGKSTLLSTLVRLADPTSGSVLRDDVDLARIEPAMLRAQTAFVSQGTALISGTIADNLRIGREDATDDELWAALEVAAAADFVRARSDGLSAKVAQEGRNFSGGQRQRLALARAVVRAPALYVLDDPFSALDVDTERTIIARLAHAHPDATIVVAAQRVSSVRHAETIAVIDGGRITDIGDDATLLAQSAIYRELASAQAVLSA